MMEMLDKITLLRDACDKREIRRFDPTGEKKSEPFDIQVDGGIDLKTAALCAKSGANLFVAGTSFFSAENWKEVVADYEKLRGLRTF